MAIAVCDTDRCLPVSQGKEGHRVAADVLSADYHDEADLLRKRRRRVPNGLELHGSSILIDIRKKAQHER